MIVRTHFLLINSSMQSTIKRLETKVLAKDTTTNATTLKGTQIAFCQKLAKC